MIYELLFERPVALLALWLVAQIVLLCLWRSRRSRATARAAWVCLGVIPFLITLSMVVITPRERIITICRELARCVDEGDIPGIAAQVSEDFESEGLDRDTLLDGIERALTNVRVDNPRLRRFEITFSDQHTGSATFDATCSVRSVDYDRGRLVSRWRITVHYAGDDWLVTGIESLPVPPLNFRRLGEWLR